MFEKRQLKCLVRKGMFSNERYVVFHMIDGEEASFFVPLTAVQGEVDHEGSVAVDVYRDKGKLWAVLPTDYRVNVVVNEADLLTA